MKYSKRVKMAYVLKGKKGEKPDIISATDKRIMDVDYPTPVKKRGVEMTSLDFAILSFYVHNLPDFRGNEVMLKVSMNSRDDENSDNKENFSTVMEFNVKDQSFAGGFYSRLVFRNVYFRNDVELGVQLKELDRKINKWYPKVKKVIDDIGGIDSIDFVQNLPYSKMITKFSDSVFEQLSDENFDDDVWDTIPTMSLSPFEGGVILRPGIYIMYQPVSKTNTQISHKDFIYKDGEVEMVTNEDKSRTNYIVFSFRFNEKH